MRTIAVINQKGGVGKTTTVANLGAAIASRGRPTCLIDLDPQAHLTLHFGIEPGRPRANVYDVLTAGAALPSTLIRGGPNLWLAPAVIDLAAAETELVTTVGREKILHDQITAHPLPCEFILIDCPPSLGLLTLNALAAADDMLIPVQPHFLALQGLGKLLETADLVRRRINPNLRVSGVVFCLYEQNTRLAAEVLADLRSFFDAARDTHTPWSQTRIFRTAIRRNIKLAECPSYGRTIFDYEPSCRGAQDYGTLAEEFLAWADGLDWQPPPERAILAESAQPPAAAEEEEQGAEAPDAEADEMPAEVLAAQGQPCAAGNAPDAGAPNAEAPAAVAPPADPPPIAPPAAEPDASPPPPEPDPHAPERPNGPLPASVPPPQDVPAGEPSPP